MIIVLKFFLETIPEGIVERSLRIVMRRQKRKTSSQSLPHIAEYLGGQTLPVEPLHDKVKPVLLSIVEDQSISEDVHQID